LRSLEEEQWPFILVDMGVNRLDMVGDRTSAGVYGICFIMKSVAREEARDGHMGQRSKLFLIRN
jgi:hypothetical protein